MNERIQKLAIQAGFTGWTQQTTIGLELEKFAELIVRECIAWVEDNNGHDGPSISEMKEHFGVE